MSAVKGISNYAKYGYEMYINDLDLMLQTIISSVIVATNQNFATFIIQNATKLDRNIAKKEAKEHIEYIDNFLKRKVDENIYYSSLGLKGILECYINDAFMDKIGFKCYENEIFNVVEYGKTYKEVNEKMKKLKKGYEEWLQEQAKIG